MKSAPALAAVALEEHFKRHGYDTFQKSKQAGTPDESTK